MRLKDFSRIQTTIVYYVSMAKAHTKRMRPFNNNRNAMAEAFAVD